MMPRIRNIRALPAALSLCAAALVAQNNPPPFPRKDVVELLNNDRVEIWDVL
jgi:hypothetical protein